MYHPTKAVIMTGLVFVSVLKQNVLLVRGHGHVEDNLYHSSTTVPLSKLMITTSTTGSYPVKCNKCQNINWKHLSCPCSQNSNSYFQSNTCFRKLIVACRKIHLIYFHSSQRSSKVPLRLIHKHKHMTELYPNRPTEELIPQCIPTPQRVIKSAASHLTVIYLSTAN